LAQPQHSGWRGLEDTGEDGAARGTTHHTVRSPDRSEADCGSAIEGSTSSDAGRGPKRC